AIGGLISRPRVRDGRSAGHVSAAHFNPLGDGFLVGSRQTAKLSDSRREVVASAQLDACHLGKKLGTAALHRITRACWHTRLISLNGSMTRARGMPLPDNALRLLFDPTQFTLHSGVCAAGAADSIRS